METIKQSANIPYLLPVLSSHNKDVSYLSPIHLRLESHPLPSCQKLTLFPYISNLC